VQFTGNGIQGFIPGYPGELTLATLPGAFHRIPESVRDVNVLSVGTAALAGTELRLLAAVGFDARYFAVPDMNRQDTSPAAIVAA
jgi:hypothetical protein